MKKQRKVRYFDRFYNQKEFFASEIEASLFDQQPNDLDWYHVKLLLRHKSCTHEFRQRYISSNTWYHRLVACLAKPARSHYAVIAMQDLDPRVYRSVFHRSDPVEVICSLEACDATRKYYESGNHYQKLCSKYMYEYALEYALSLKNPALGLLSPNEDIRRITKERLDVLSKVQR